VLHLCQQLQQRIEHLLWRAGCPAGVTLATSAAAAYAAEQLVLLVSASPGRAVVVEEVQDAAARFCPRAIMALLPTSWEDAEPACPERYMREHRWVYLQQFPRVPWELTLWLRLDDPSPGAAAWHTAISCLPQQPQLLPKDVSPNSGGGGGWGGHAAVRPPWS
jgi:hypothetical protein